MFRTRATVWDLIAALAVLLVAVLLLVSPFLWRKEGEILEVSTPEGSTTYSLREDREIRVSAGAHTLLIVIEDGAAYVRESDCPDGVCRKSGRISQSGESVICAPAGVRLLVKGGDRDVDFIAG